MLKSRRAIVIEGGREGGQVISMRRESSITTLAANGAINADQVCAAFRFRNAWLITMEATRESVGFDEWRAPAGPGADVMAKRQEASETLANARSLVGAYAYGLMCRVCGEGYSINELYGPRRAKETHIDILKIHLAMLARAWGMVIA